MKKKFFVTYTFARILYFVSDIKTTEILVDITNGINSKIIHDALIDTIDLIDDYTVTIISWSEIVEPETITAPSDEGDCVADNIKRYYPHVDDTLRSKTFNLELNEGLLGRALTDRAKLLESCDNINIERYHEITETVEALLEEKYNLMYAIKMDKDCTEDLYKRLVDGYNIDEDLLV